MSIEKELQNARTMVERFSKVDLSILDLTLFDLGANGVEGLGGYIATFNDSEDVEAILRDANPGWLAELASLPRTAKALDAETAIREAIAKCETELQTHIKKHFRYSHPLLEFQTV